MGAGGRPASSQPGSVRQRRRARLWKGTPRPAPPSARVPLGSRAGEAVTSPHRRGGPLRGRRRDPNPGRSSWSKHPLLQGRCRRPGWPIWASTRASRGSSSAAHAHDVGPRAPPAVGPRAQPTWLSTTCAVPRRRPGVASAAPTAPSRPGGLGRRRRAAASPQPHALSSASGTSSADPPSSTRDSAFFVSGGCGQGAGQGTSKPDDAAGGEACPPSAHRPS